MTQESYPKANTPFDLPQWRRYHADDTGVLGAPGSLDRQVLIDGSGPYVKRLPGVRMIQGVRGADDETWQATVTPNASGLWRYDRIVDHLAADGVITTVLLAGTAGVTPGLPDLTQEPGGVWEEDLGWFRVKPGFTGITPGEAQLIDTRTFLPSRNTPVLREELRPPFPRINDQVTFPDGARQRWTGSAWEKEGPSLTDWAMGVTSGTYGWQLTSQYGKWSRSGEVIDAFGVASLNANPPGGATGQLIFTLPPLGASVPEGTVVGTADLGPAGGGVSHHGYVRVDSGIGRVYSFTSPITVAPANGWTLTVQLRYSAVAT